jgi:signal transduction histidine kinase
MERLLETKSTPATTREWALFGLRWATPLGLVLFILNSLGTNRLTTQEMGLIAVVAFLATISNLGILLLILSERWMRILIPLSIGVDIILAIAAVAVSSPTVGWVGMVPAVVAGFYFGWMPGLGAGTAVAIGMMVVQFVPQLPHRADIPSLIFAVLVVPACGPLAYFLASDKSEIDDLRDQVKVRGKRSEQITRMATEYMRVVYEMTEVLSASKLDPKRVLLSAVTFSVDALKRVGTAEPVYSAVLLFASGDDGLGHMLKIARASENVKGHDLKASVPGATGTIATTLNLQRPSLNHAPDADPELSTFESFRKCGTVVCVPLGSGHEVYGVMLVGTKDKDAFREMHVELIRAVANQAAASLNNARLYGSLVEQRDRLVEIEKAARAQLASELHDGITQDVASLAMRLNLIRKLLEKKPENALEELYKSEDLARRATKQIRHLLFELRPMALDQGLAAGLEQLGNKTLETYEQKVEIQVDPKADRMLDSQTTQTLFSIAQETVNNARKHAKADVIHVRVAVEDNTLIMEIYDQGLGFDVEAALVAAGKREGHLGLINLQERARLVEGTLEIWSEPGKGSRTTVAIPLDVLRARKTEEADRTAVAIEVRA